MLDDMETEVLIRVLEGESVAGVCAAEAKVNVDFGISLSAVEHAAMTHATRERTRNAATLLNILRSLLRLF